MAKAYDTTSQDKLKDVTDEEVSLRAQDFSTISELAQIYDVPDHIFYFRFKKAIDKGRGITRANLRGKYIDMALNGDVKALSQLAKSILGFTDEGFKEAIPKSVQEVTPAEVTSILKKKSG